MGLLFAQQRRITGGIQAPMLIHLVWSAMMLGYLPPLSADQFAEERSFVARVRADGGPVRPRRARPDR
jgi:hypothetical protein